MKTKVIYDGKYHVFCYITRNYLILILNIIYLEFLLTCRSKKYKMYGLLLVYEQNPGNIKKKKKNFMAPFYGWGLTASRLEPLGGGSLLFTTNPLGHSPLTPY